MLIPTAKPLWLTLWSWIVDLVVKFFDLLGQKIRSKFLTFYKGALTAPVYVNLKINVNHEISEKSVGPAYINGVRFFHGILYWCCVMVRKIPIRRGVRMGHTDLAVQPVTSTLRPRARTNIIYITGVDRSELKGLKPPAKPKLNKFLVDKRLNQERMPLLLLQKELMEIAIKNLTGEINA